MADTLTVHPIILGPGVVARDTLDGRAVSFDPQECNQCIEDFEATDVTLYGDDRVQDDMMSSLPYPVDGIGGEQTGWATVMRPIGSALQTIRANTDKLFRDMFIVSASGLGLSRIGLRYKFPRAPYETDDCYRRRMIRFNSLRRQLTDLLVPSVLEDNTVITRTETFRVLRGTTISVMEAILQDLPFVQRARVRCGDDLVSWTVFAPDTAFPDEDDAHTFYFTAPENANGEAVNIWIFGSAARTMLLTIDLWRHSVTPWEESEKSIVRTIIDTHLVAACSAYVLRLHTAAESIT